MTFPLARTPETPDENEDHVLFTHPRTWLRDLDPFARTWHQMPGIRRHGKLDDELRKRIAYGHDARAAERRRQTCLWPGVKLSECMSLAEASIAIHPFFTRKLERIEQHGYMVEYNQSPVKREAIVPFPVAPSDDIADVSYVPRTRFGTATYTPMPLFPIDVD